MHAAAQTTLCILVLCLSVAASAAQQQHPDTQTRTLLSRALQAPHHFKDRFAAQVWLVDMNARLQPYVKDAQERLAILTAVHQEASRAQLDPQLVLAVVHVESLFNRYAISRAGARGLMQVMPFWTAEIGRSEDNLFDIRTNLRYGCTILRSYLDREQGNVTRALGRYNGSLGQYWYPRRVFKAFDQHWLVP